MGITTGLLIFTIAVSILAAFPKYRKEYLVLAILTDVSWLVYCNIHFMYFFIIFWTIMLFLDFRGLKKLIESQNEQEEN